MNLRMLLMCGALAAAAAAPPVLSASHEERGESADFPISGMRRVFAAGFESPVTVESNLSGRRAWLKGTDSSGYSWDALNHVFELVAPLSFNNLIDIEFSSSNPFSGKRSLFLRQNERKLGTQNRLQFFSDDKTFDGEIATRRMYYIPSSNLNTLRNEWDAVSIGGTRETRGGIFSGEPKADFSMPLYLVRRGDRLVFAQAIVDYSAGSKWSDWTRPPKGLVTYGAEVSPPMDAWFQLDTYILRHPEQGKIKVWLDGKLIFDLDNVRTKNDGDEWFTKLADIDGSESPLELWVDDVEIWARQGTKGEALLKPR